jgi:hypothetical protein
MKKLFRSVRAFPGLRVFGKAFLFVSLIAILSFSFTACSGKKSLDNQKTVTIPLPFITGQTFTMTAIISQRKEKVGMNGRS